jgi:endogenous inhibitor of DNA gyrase (YacG/DUF329 family)
MELRTATDGWHWRRVALATGGTGVSPVLAAASSHTISQATSMPTANCSICGKTFDLDRSPAMPFCSPRCRGIDRQRWIDERYGLPYESELDLDQRLADEDRGD